VNLFYEVYGATTPLYVTYQVEGQEVDGRWIALGQPSRGNPDVLTQAWELPTSTEWPTGAYRVRIDVRDSEDRLISSQVPFTLEAAGDPP